MESGEEEGTWHRARKNYNSLEWRGGRAARGTNLCTSQKDSYPIRLASGNCSYQSSRKNWKSQNL